MKVMTKNLKMSLEKSQVVIVPELGMSSTTKFRIATRREFYLGRECPNLNEKILSLYIKKCRIILCNAEPTSNY